MTDTHVPINTYNYLHTNTHTFNQTHIYYFDDIFPHFTAKSNRTKAVRFVLHI